MGLQPLEFTDGLTDSPFFRETLQAHERELDLTNTAIKHLIKDIKDLIAAARNLSRAQRTLSETLNNFNFECIGNSQTDDEMVIANSFKDFARLLATIEDERDRLLEKADEAFLEPIERFRRDQIGSAKEAKKKFEKETAKYCQNLERYLNLSVKKSETQLWEADANNSMEQQHFFKAMSEYVLKLQEVNERKKFEFVETVLSFMLGWLTFYHQGHEIATDFYSVKMELQMRLQRTRNNFNMTQEETKSLRQKMLNNQEKFKQKFQDSCSFNKNFNRQGYLFLMEKKAFTTSWTKHFCKYEKNSRRMTIIQYTQTIGKINYIEDIIVKECIKRSQDTIDRRFCFDIVTYPDDHQQQHHHHHHHHHYKFTSLSSSSNSNSGHNSSGSHQQPSSNGQQTSSSSSKGSSNQSPNSSSDGHSNAVVYTFQALSEEDYKHWLTILDARDGCPPNQSQMNRHKQTSKSSNDNNKNNCTSDTKIYSASFNDCYHLDAEGYWFVKKCIQSIEAKGLEHKGIYRVVGVTSRVRTLMEMFTNSKSNKNNSNDSADSATSDIDYIDNVDLLPNFDVNSDDYETKTLTSALKNYLRHLTEPIMTFKLHNSFILAAKLENRALRIEQIHQLVHQLPSINFKILKILMEHLQKVAKLHDKNLMTSSNLGVCFGPTLLRTAEESVAAILDIKFVNVIAELLIENYEKFFLSKPNVEILESPCSGQTDKNSANHSNYMSVNNAIQQRPLPNVPAGQQQQQNYVATVNNIVRNMSSPLNESQQQTTGNRPGFIPSNLNQTNVRRSNSQDQLYTAIVNRSKAIYNSPNNSTNHSPSTSSSTTAPGNLPIAILQHPQHSKGQQQQQQQAQYLLQTNYSGNYSHYQQLATSPTGAASPSMITTTAIVHHHPQQQYPQMFYKLPSSNHQISSSSSLYGHIRASNHQNNQSATQLLQPSVSYQNLHYNTELTTNNGDKKYQSSLNTSMICSGQYSRPMTSIGIIPPNSTYATLMIRQPDNNQSVNSNNYMARPINFSSSSSASLPSTPEHSQQFPYVNKLPQMVSVQTMKQSTSGLNRHQIDSPGTGSSDVMNESLYSSTTAAAASLYGHHHHQQQQQRNNAQNIYGSVGSNHQLQQQRLATIQQAAVSSSSPKSPQTLSSSSSLQQQQQQQSPLPGTRVRTRYACIGGSESELSFRPNEVITNVRRSREPGWLEGNLDGKTGLIPQNYVEFLD